MLVALTAVAWGIALFNGYILNLPFPLNWPLLNPMARFSDLTDYLRHDSRFVTGRHSGARIRGASPNLSFARTADLRVPHQAVR